MRFNHNMEDDDEFGDLYTDIRLTPVPPPPTSNQNPSTVTPGVGRGASTGEKDKKILFGSFRPAAPAPESSIFQERPASAEDADDDWLLGRDPLPVEEPVNWVDDDDEEVVARASRDTVGGPRVPEKEEAREASRVFKEEDEDEAGGGGSVEKTPVNRDLHEEPVIPGLSAVPSSSNVQNGELVKASWSDDWDSGSEDDLKIVLNDTTHGLQEEERRGRGGSYEDDEDEDLVIVTDEDQHHHQQAMEDQGWGDDALQPSADGEKKEMLDAAKASGVEANASGAGIGYSNHSFHPQHHSMFKYVRPGAGPTPRGPGIAAAGAPGQIRPPVMGPFAGRGRGDWRPVGGNGYPNSQKGFLPGYGLPLWGSTALGRPFGGGLDFTLPSHKTVFDIDIESFEEKPWRYPGIDISDFFNFGLDEEHWKEYCKQVEQLRLESTMQSKIRVYESGRSEQDYDPDLPPELAAATGHSNVPADNTNHGKSDNVQGDLIGQGRGTVCMRPPLPTGRAIQVEGGYGERLPSIDTRPPRIRDSDAIIEIVLQDNLIDLANSNGSQPADNFEGEHVKGCDVDDEDDRPAESEYCGHFPRSSNGQQRESMERRGDAMLSFPSESSHQYNSSPKSQTPSDTAISFGTQHGVRLSQRTSRGKDSSTSKRSSVTPPSRNMHLDKDVGPHKEKASNEMEGNEAPDLLPSDVDEITRKLSMESKDVGRDDRRTLGDSHEGNGEEASDFRVSSETVGDDGRIHSENRKKSSSCVEQSAAQDNVDGNYSRLTQSDNSRAKSGNSKDYQKSHESGEEVMQVRPSKRTGDFRKHHEEDIHVGRDNYGREGRRERDRARSRVTETMHQSYAHKDWDTSSGHTFRGRSEGFERERDGSVSAWHRREDDNHIRQVKNEDVRRGRNEEIKPMERSNVRVTDRKEKVEDHVKKRVDDGDWRGHNRDGGLRHRERDDILLSRRENFEDSLMKRKRDVEFVRRERADKGDSLHGFRGREDSSRRKRSRDDIVEHRKREEDVRAKSKTEEHQSSKHKDDNWYQRDREDRQRLKLSHDDTIVLREREERQLPSRSGRPMEGKALAGSGRSKEDLKVTGSDKDYHDKDRKRPNEQAKRGDRTVEENESSNKVHADPHAHAREKRFNTEQRSMRHERSSGHTDGQQVKEGRHHESSRKIKNTESVGKNREVSGKRKHEDHGSHRTKLNSKGSREEESNKTSTTEGKKVQDNSEQLEASLLPAARHGEEVPASDDESHESRRGRSKLERWTSHKERDYSTIHNNIQPLSIVREGEDSQGEANELVKAADTHKADVDETKAGDALQAADNVGDDRDRHLDTVAKLKMRSERFKLPMPGEKDLTGSKKAEGEALPPIQNEAASAAAADMDVKLERPARKRRWTGN